MKTCPRCGRETMRDIDVKNALSRRCDVYICSGCGMEEAMEDAGFTEKIPVSEWVCNKNGE